MMFDAFEFAMTAHGKQVRKYTNEPYWGHLVEVAGLVAMISGTPTMIKAAVLHDVLEDTDVTAQEISEKFGQPVSEFVQWLTNTPARPGTNRAERKAKDIERLSKAPAQVHSIKLADLISNTKSIALHDPKFAQVYIAEKADLLKVLVKGDQRLWKIANKLVTDFYERKEHDGA